MADALPLLKATQNTCTCRVCLDVLKDPVAFHCGHVLCRSCAERCITARPRCPLCNHAVPNTRHLLPLPQLSLFCVCVREVGLRVQQLQPTTLLRDESRTAKRDHVDVNAVAKRARRESSPTPPWNAADTLSELLLRSTLSGTQRLHSESPPGHTPPPQGSIDGGSELSGGEGDRAEDSLAAATELAVRDGSDVMRREDHNGSHTSPPLSSTTTTTTTAAAAAAPSAPAAAQTLALLQAHFAEEAEQVDLTPRLDRSGGVVITTTASDVPAPAPLIDMSAISSSGASLPSTATTAEDSPSLWRLWRRGMGVVHCALHPPALRLEAASRARQQPPPQAESSSGMSSSHQPRDALSAVEVTRLHRAGTCLLCGLDVVQRAAVRQRLQRLLRSAAAHCDPVELAAQTEDSLALLLGPLWSVTCRYDTDASSTDTCSSGAGVYTVGREAGSSLPEAGLCGVAHHNCLCWAGLLDLYTDTSSTPAVNAPREAVGTSRTVLAMTVPMADPVRLCPAHTSGRVARWQLLAATLWRLHRFSSAGGGVQQGGRRDVGGAMVASRCALCAGPTASVLPFVAPDAFGAGLRSCEGAERGESSCGRLYHYPCALLAGASACVVFGLEEKGNVLRDADDVCVRCAEPGGVRGEGPAVEVWCGSCHTRHESRRRSRGP